MATNQRRAKRRLVVELHERTGITEKPIGDVKEVHTDPRGTRVETEDNTHYFPREQYEKVVTQWEEGDSPNHLIEEFK